MKFDVEPRLIDAPSLRMSFFSVPWDTEIFGFPVVQIREMELRDGDPQPAFSEFERWCHGLGSRLVCCRLSHDRLRESGFLEQRLFRFIEMVYQPRFDGLNEAESLGEEVQIAVAEAADISEIEAIARVAFLTGRHVIDPRLDPRLGHDRYSIWIRNSLKNSRHQVVKALVGDRIAGFFIVEERADRTAYWHLTAIAPAFQGRGFGKSLWRSMMHRHRAAGMRAIETTISARNTVVLNLYARLGFRFGNAEMTLHRTEDPVGT